MGNIKQDLSTYKEIKKIKNEFNKEIKSVKSYIYKNKFKEAKESLKKCDKYLVSMKGAIDRLPDKADPGVAKRLIPLITALLGGIIAEVGMIHEVNHGLDKLSNDPDVGVAETILASIGGSIVLSGGTGLNAIATTAGTVGGAVAFVSLKPLKAKANDIFKKCIKSINNTKAYLDKAKKTSKAVKESLNETLDNLHEAFTEGAIDEFEYDTLIDHLLS